MSINQAIEALQIGIREINMLGGARQAMPLHEALAALRSMPAEPVAWRTFDGEGGYEYRSYEHNEEYAKEWAKRNPRHLGWVDPLYTQAPAQQPLTNQSPSPEYDRGFSDGWDEGYAYGIAAQKGTT